MDADAPRLDPSRSVEDARLVKARLLVPLARAIRDSAKLQADAIGRTERRFGSDPARHLARLLDDLWMAADNFICDVEFFDEV